MGDSLVAALEREAQLKEALKECAPSLGRIMMNGWEPCEEDEAIVKACVEIVGIQIGTIDPEVNRFHKEKP